MTNSAMLPSPEIERSALNKILMRLTPFLAILYVFNLLDRNNVSIAALSMQQDLRFSDAIYGVGAGIFFIGYFLFEVPSNLIMERVGARRWIARIMISWGAVSTAMMFVRSPLSFYSLRFLLGLAEAGFYPGIVLYITYWVPANARAQVISRFLFLTAILGLFGGPLGGQLLKMRGLYGLMGWQWLFLLEGIPSILLGFVVLTILPNGPQEARWLSDAEKNWITARLAQEARNEQRVQHLSLRVALTEPRIRHLCLIFIFTSIGGNAVGFFAPKLIKARSAGLWSDSFVATVGIIPAIVGAVAMVVAATHSDRSGKRHLHVAFGYLVAAIGFLACVFTPTAEWTVAALALNALGERIAAGSYWAVTTNLMGARAAAGGIAMINSVGNLGGFFGPILMGKLKEWNHGDYTPGLYAAVLFILAGSMLSYMLRHHPSSSPPSLNDLAEETAALSQPEQHAP